jgi:transposase
LISSLPDVCLRHGPHRQKLVHTNIRNNDFDYFLKLVAPYRHDLTVCAECMFGWYWLADACQSANIHFVLAHALYLKAIHGGKNKNDRVDSEKITHLLRTNLIPPGYVYPAAKRPLRALLRQRLLYVWNRSELGYFHHATLATIHAPTWKFATGCMRSTSSARSGMANCKMLD